MSGPVAGPRYVFQYVSIHFSVKLYIRPRAAYATFTHSGQTTPRFGLYEINLVLILSHRTLLKIKADMHVLNEGSHDDVNLWIPTATIIIVS